MHNKGGGLGALGEQTLPIGNGADLLARAVLTLSNDDEPSLPAYNDVDRKSTAIR